MTDTIAAIATAPGRGGVGIVRISGPLSLSLANTLLGFTPSPRQAHYCAFKNALGFTLDQGIALYFKGPHSFTGEDVLELQGHGGPFVLDALLDTILSQGARMARPGEFSERAFLNDKMDLTQAEAIADLIDASSQQAAKNALQSLQGAFSKHVDSLVDRLTHLRIYVESAIDFPDEEIDFLSDGVIADGLSSLKKAIEDTLAQAQQGVLCRDGMKVVITGRPNAGKSSLLNCLAEKDVAIVTDIAGTTRDLIHQHLSIDGMPLHIVDTAGLRDHADEVEKIGIERAKQEIDQADRILLMIDASDKAQCQLAEHWPEFLAVPYKQKLTVILNKTDLQPDAQLVLPESDTSICTVSISAKQHHGIDSLKTHLKEVMGYQGTNEGSFSARRRHVDALQRSLTYVAQAQIQLDHYAAGELVAEDLRQAQEVLGEITGKLSADDLLGNIFSSFCIGK